MLELYHSPFACSAACRAAAATFELPLKINLVDLRAKTIADGGSFLDINSKGYVAALRLEDGSILTETAAILTYLGSIAPDRARQPKPPSPAYFSMLAWTNYVASELHKQIFAVHFNPYAPEEAKKFAHSLVPMKLQPLDEHLETGKFLLDDIFTTADIYLTWWLFLTHRTIIDFSDFKNLGRYFADAMEIPEVKNSLEADF